MHVNIASSPLGTTLFSVPEGRTSLAIGAPDHVLRSGAASLVKASTQVCTLDPLNLQYGHLSGCSDFRRLLASYLNTVYGERSPIDPANLFVTTGATNGLHLAVTALLPPSRRVIFVETPTYFLALRVFSDLGCFVVPIPTDDDGPIPAAFEKAARSVAAGEVDAADPRAVPLPVPHSVDATGHPYTETTAASAAAPPSTAPFAGGLYLVPSHSNPTSRVISTRRRKALISIAQRERVVILADDVYEGLPFEAGVRPRQFSAAHRDDTREGGAGDAVGTGATPSLGDWLEPAEAKVGGAGGKQTSSGVSGFENVVEAICEAMQGAAVSGVEATSGTARVGGEGDAGEAGEGVGGVVEAGGAGGGAPQRESVSTLPPRCVALDAASDGVGVTLSIGSLSKVLGPGVRLGWLEGPRNSTILQYFNASGIAASGGGQQGTLLGLLKPLLEPIPPLQLRNLSARLTDLHPQLSLLAVEPAGERQPCGSEVGERLPLSQLPSAPSGTVTGTTSSSAFHSVSPLLLLQRCVMTTLEARCRALRRGLVDGLGERVRDVTISDPCGGYFVWVTVNAPMQSPSTVPTPTASARSPPTAAAGAAAAPRPFSTVDLLAFAQESVSVAFTPGASFSAFAALCPTPQPATTSIASPPSASGASGTGFQPVPPLPPPPPPPPPRHTLLWPRGYDAEAKRAARDVCARSLRVSFAFYSACELEVAGRKLGHVIAQCIAAADTPP